MDSLNLLRDSIAEKDTEQAQMLRFHTVLSDLIKIVTDLNDYLRDEFGKEEVSSGIITLANASFSVINPSSDILKAIVSHFIKRGAAHTSKILENDRVYFAKIAPSLVPEISGTIMSSVVSVINTPNLSDADVAQIFERVVILMKIGLKYAALHGVDGASEAEISDMNAAITKFGLV